MNKEEIRAKRVSIFLIVLSLIVFLATQLLTYRKVSKDAYSQSEEYVSAVLNGINTRFDLDGRITEEMARAFLSSWFDFKDSLSSGNTLPPGYIADSDLRTFKNEVFASIENFMKTSKGKAFSCEFAVVPGIYPETGDKYFIPYADAYGGNVRDGGPGQDPDKVYNFKNLLKSESARWFIPAENSPFKGYAVTYFVPLKREDESVFGMFALNAGLEEIKKLFLSSLPYGVEGSAFVVYEQSAGTICSVGSEDLIQKAMPSIEDPDGNSLPDDICLFKTSMDRYPWKVYILCDKNIVFERARGTTLAVSSISVTGLLLIFLCLFLINRRMNKGMEARIQAENAIHLAAEVQLHMLKAPQVSDSRFKLKAWLKPALEAGGDLYDYTVKDDKLIFIIGDVSGKGIGAALFMAQVCSLFRSMAAASDDPRSIVSGINSVLAEDNVSMTFCTLIVGALDLSTGKVELCNAGHTKPVLIKDGKASLFNITPSLPAAIEEEFDYTTDSIVLGHGDGMLLYTDGVNEARSRSHELFGEERLIAALGESSGPEFDTLLSSLSNFTEGEPQSDDITILSFRYL